TIRTSGEINRPATGSANLLPICYGVVENNGTIRSGSGNFSVSIDPSSSNKFYVDIDNVDFDIDNHIALVSAYGISGANAAYEKSDTGSGELLIFTDAGLGGSPAFAFSFIVYEP
ncbi:MAG: hypothetical protein HKN76_10165, partial [Saprospiraceae bacterium]|nr:hypothetical protein [Saprospiraceae bacterium]